ncbi:MAG: FolB domain-containing protein [Bacteroidota bacterium]
MAIINIKDLLLRTEVGFNPHELGKKQDLMLNIAIEYSTAGEEISDDPVDALNYRDICKKIIGLVENNRYNLIEKVAHDVVDLIFEEPRVHRVSIEVDKPHALRFARSVSFSFSQTRAGK